MFDIIPMKGGLGTVEGFYCDGVNCGMREGEQPDLAYIRSATPCDITATFTTNRFQAAPIKHYQRYKKGFQTDFLLINAKNANAMTGERGIRDIDTIFEAIGEKIELTNPVMSSTGVIGYPLPTEKIIDGFEKFDLDARNSARAAEAIMTTDRFPKELAFEVTLEDGSSFHIAGICKGAGMINPAMATMLCFIVTDADIPAAEMDLLLRESVDTSFNTISVDGDTSTNDSVFLLASRESGSYDREAFRTALDMLTHRLAMMILEDGEGANKVVAFEVSGAATKADAIKASKTLSNSLLVKTALFGEDPNWGRIASTIGASGITCDETRLVIRYEDLIVYSSDYPVLDAQREAKAAEIMKRHSYKIRCDIGVGEASHTSYGCDLSYDYVKINADYRT
ncbi:MAG TPA: bifunctional glutamate N-acetyltransferase/amino-acid acetyltransferase ArgJ [Campylobacteraceae bacterium]|nr:bifunctional glutamate N-acetyltransferase/amino-acid acetyltransferase ArgJ [Campylobacteraceae bacterium]HHD83674.1 bifunctional glutamate N-acetyltransferase/amino-acid acetyltransferase ArgJ [Campylobacteraceae bacterium]